MPSSYTPASIATPVAANLGGTGVANNAASTLTISGNFGTTFTVGGATTLTLPATGTLATLAGAETLTNKTISGPSATMAGSVVANASNASGTVVLTGGVADPTSQGGIYFGVTPSAGNHSILGVPGTGLTINGAGGVDVIISVQLDRIAAFQSGDMIVYKTLQLGPGQTSKVGGTIFDDFTDAATTHTDGTEDTLYTHTLQAGQFSANGDKITGSYQLAIVGHAISTDRIRLYCAGTAIFDTTALNFPLGCQLTIEYMVIRVSASVLRASVAATTNSATVIAYSQYVEVTGLTLANSQVVALKAIATGTNSAAGDVTAKLGTIIWQPSQ